MLSKIIDKIIDCVTLNTGANNDVKVSLSSKDLKKVTKELVDVDNNKTGNVDYSPGDIRTTIAKSSRINIQFVKDESIEEGKFKLG